jgi:hypothetical protein
MVTGKMDNSPLYGKATATRHELQTEKAFGIPEIKTTEPQSILSRVKWL